MKRQLQIFITLLFAGYAIFALVALPALAQAMPLTPVQHFLIVAASIVFFVILGTLGVEIIFGLPVEKLESFLETLGKRRQMPGPLPFAAPLELHRLYGAFRSVTAALEKQVEGLRHLADYVEVRHRFLTTISHRLRTPLTGLRWALNELSERGSLGAGKHNLLADSIASAKRIALIVDDLIEISRVETGFGRTKEDSVDILGVIRNVVAELSLFSKSRGVTVSVRNGQGPLPVIRGDRRQLELALNNIVANAITYSFAGGSVTISARESGNLIAVAVADQGIGIPEAEQSHLFEEFTRGTEASAMNTEGTGLGLYLAKGIVSNHRGDIRVESSPGKGSVFTVTLPLKGRGELEAFMSR